jgi:tRNA-splicing ligase RtcB
MGEASVILEGADTPGARAASYSTVHGAGRRLSRTQAAGKVGVAFECSVRDCGYWVPPTPRTRKHERCPRHPDAYKRLADHGDTIRVLHSLKPIGVAMAGADTFDPYKD